MYRYIGNKTKILPNIIEKVNDVIGNEGTVVDLMAGTGSVSLALSNEGYDVIAADMMTYSKFHLIFHLLVNEPPAFNGLYELRMPKQTAYESVIEYLNNIDSIEGYFFKEFSPNGSPENGCESRKYFTSSNACKIDAIREKINSWIYADKITEEEEAILKHTLIMAVNKVANISGTYGYFLSSFGKGAQQHIELSTYEFIKKESNKHQVIQGFAEDIARDITADLCYIDPPYIKRQYAANYHILETIARGDFPVAVGKSGLRDWWDQHSKFCTKTKSLDSFEKIVSEMNCPHFLISYSEDGLLEIEQLEQLFNKYGEVLIHEIEYKRFKSNKSNLPLNIKEFIIEVNKNV